MSSPSESYSKTTRSKSGKPKHDTSRVTTDSPGAAISMQLRNFKPDDPKGKAKATKKKTSVKSSLSSDVGNAKMKATLGNASGSNAKEKATPAVISASASTSSIELKATDPSPSTTTLPVDNEANRRIIQNDESTPAGSGADSSVQNKESITTTTTALPCHPPVKRNRIANSSAFTVTSGDLVMKDDVAKAGNQLGDDDSDTQLLSHDPFGLHDIIAKDQPLDDYIDEVLQETEKNSASSKAVDQLVDADADHDAGSYTDRKQPSKKDVILVYPFIGGECIELATAPLDLCLGHGTKLDDKHLKLGDTELRNLQKAHSTSSFHTLSFTKLDRSKLLPRTYVNDTIIDFWFRWITRKEYPHKSTVHCFTTHFYTTLLDQGCEGVTRWTTKRGIDIFCKKMIFVPIHLSSHWSLLVVLNPGKVTASLDVNEDESLKVEVPAMLFFDSLKLHPKLEIADKIRDWLNHEWKKKNNCKDNIFNMQTIEIFSPKGK